MECASLCKIFESSVSALEWIARHKLGISGILHILDDLLIFERDNRCARKAYLISIGPVMS